MTGQPRDDNTETARLEKRVFRRRAAIDGLAPPWTIEERQKSAGSPALAADTAKMSKLLAFAT